MKRQCPSTHDDQATLSSGSSLNHKLLPSRIGLSSCHFCVFLDQFWSGILEHTKRWRRSTEVGSARGCSPGELVHVVPFNLGDVLPSLPTTSFGK